MAVAVPTGSAFVVSLDAVKQALNLTHTTAHDAELGRYIAAAQAHVARTVGGPLSAPRTERVTASGGVLLLPAWPVQSVASITQSGTTITTGLDVDAAGVLRLSSGAHLTGRWDVTYTAGRVDVADLHLAAVEDIRGLYQASQIGAPSALGAFGEESAGGFGPVGQWPRIDAWAARQAPGIA